MRVGTLVACGLGVACGGAETARTVRADRPTGADEASTADGEREASPSGEDATRPESAAPGWAGLAVGGWHACGVDGEGQAWCWGGGGGRTGDGSLATAHAPTRAETPALRSLAAGPYGTCGVDEEGRAWCWGLGEPTPSAVGGDARFQTVVPGEGTTCGLDEAGRAWCWGYAGAGALGRPPRERRETVGTPERVPGTPPFVELALGSTAICGRTADGVVWCWGGPAREWPAPPEEGVGDSDSEAAESGVREDGDREEAEDDPARWAPHPLAQGSLRFAGLALGPENQACAWTAEGALHCWGRGLPGLDAPTTPTPVELTGPVRDVAFGRVHVCVALASGAVHCAGSNRQEGGALGGQLGTDAVAARETFAPVEGLADVVEVGAGAAHGCARTGTGTISCWGRDDLGAVGDGPPPSVELPEPVGVRIAQGRDLRALDVALDDGCALDAEGRAHCFGRELEPVAGGPAFVEVATGWRLHCGRTEEGRVLCWGRSGRRRLEQPAPLPGGQRFRALDAGRETCGLDVEGGLWCWRALEEPTRVAPDRRFTALDLPCALGEDGAALCWRGRSRTLQPIEAGAPLRALVAEDDDQGCGLDADGRAWCWGRDRVGQLGAGEPAWRRERWEAQPVAGDARFVGLAVGLQVRCGWTADGEAWCWGSNRCGELGRGERGGLSARPRRVVLDQPIEGLAILRDDGPPFGELVCGRGERGLWCWGLGQAEPRRILSDTRLRELALLAHRQGAALTTGGDLVRWSWPRDDAEREPLALCAHRRFRPVPLPPPGR